MRTYQADVWCDECGRATESVLQAAGGAPDDVFDQASYDSDDYPKWGDDDQEADTPQHCAAGPDCLRPTIIGSKPYGQFFGNALTTEGVKYVKDAYRRNSDPRGVPAFWSTYYELRCPCCKRLNEDCTCE